MKNLNRFIVLGTAAFFILVMAAGFNNEAGCEEHPTADSAVIETPKAEQPKVEQPKVEQPKAEQPKVEQPKVEHPKAEHPTTDHPK